MTLQEILLVVLAVASVGVPVLLVAGVVVGNALNRQQARLLKDQLDNMEKPLMNGKPEQPQRQWPPAPGSAEAIARGCCCPQEMNNHGAGAGHPGPAGLGAFWLADNCPLHWNGYYG